MGYEIKKVSDGVYAVTKSEDGKVYSINLNLMKCNCQGFRSWKKCKHIPMVMGYKIATEKSEPQTSAEKIKMELAFQDVEKTSFGFKCVDKIYASFQDGIILDLETTGLDPKTSEMITFGYIHGNSLVILQRVEKETEKFYNAIKKELSRIQQPIFAYYAEFEKSFLEKLFDFKGIFVDILDPWKVKANELGITAPKLDKLIPGPEKYMGEKVTTGADVVQTWQRYLKTCDLEDLMLLIRHNQIDLLQEFSALNLTALIR